MELGLKMDLKPKNNQITFLVLGLVFVFGLGFLVTVFVFDGFSNLVSRFSPLTPSVANEFGVIEGELFKLQSPPTKPVYTNRDGVRFISYVGHVESVNLDSNYVTVKFDDGNENDIKYDPIETFTCIDWDSYYSDKRFQSAFVTLYDNAYEGKCWQVSDGFKYIVSGDRVEVVWKGPESYKLRLSDKAFMFVIKPE